MNEQKIHDYIANNKAEMLQTLKELSLIPAPSNFEQGDGRFFNLETTLNHIGEACASQFSGGTYIRTNPEILEDIVPFCFNMTSFNNNHALDFSYVCVSLTALPLPPTKTAL